MKRIGSTLGAAALVLALAGCSGAPSEDELADQLASDDVIAEEHADCVADELLDSALDDEQLTAIAEGEVDDLDGDEQDVLEEAIADAVEVCSPRPSVEDIAEALVDAGDFEQEQADCAAEALVESDLSDDQLTALAEDDADALTEDEQQEVGEILGETLVECAEL